MIVDLIMLTLTTDENLFTMTQTAINTAIESESDTKFNIILLESNRESQYKYDNCTVYTPELDFNYNRFMNFGIQKSSNEWISLCNNDLIFHKNWFSEIYKHKDIAESFSPWNSYGAWHESKFVDINTDYIEGYRTSYEIAGWCLTMKRKVFDKFKLDERVDFWYSDNVYGDSLKEHNIKHILVKNSKVDHLCSKTPLGNRCHELTTNQYSKYMRY